LIFSQERCCVDTFSADMTANPYLKFHCSPWTFDERRATELEQLADGAIVVDAAGSIVFANAVAIAMHGRLIMGVRPDDYSPMHGLFTEDGRPYPSTDLPLARAAVFGETVLDARWRIRRPDGSSVTAMGDAMPLTDAQGKQTGAILLFHQTSS
jgi:PAS domain-containing protein